MQTVLLSLIIYILGIFTGVTLPLIGHIYHKVFNNKPIETEEKKQQDINTPNNLTADIISEWQTGQAVGEENE